MAHATRETERKYSKSCSVSWHKAQTYAKIYVCWLYSCIAGNYADGEKNKKGKVGAVEIGKLWIVDSGYVQRAYMYSV